MTDPTPESLALAIPDPRAWRVAIALAHECGLDWARWARDPLASTRMVPAPWDAAAYLADCARWRSCATRSRPAGLRRTALRARRAAAYVDCNPHDPHRSRRTGARDSMGVLGATPPHPRGPATHRRPMVRPRDEGKDHDMTQPRDITTRDQAIAYLRELDANYDLMGRDRLRSTSAPRSVLGQVTDRIDEMWPAAVVADSPELAQVRAALSTINGIRNSIIGSQSINWSEHIYPLVAALNAAGFPGENYPVARENFGTLAERAFAAEAELAQARERIAALEHEIEIWDACGHDVHAVTARCAAADRALIAAERRAEKAREDLEVSESMRAKEGRALTRIADAALARVAELEATIDGPEGWRARVHALVAAAQPKGCEFILGERYAIWGDDAGGWHWTACVPGGVTLHPGKRTRDEAIGACRRHAGLPPLNIYGETIVSSEGAAHPKPRDESVPPPGWEWDDEDDGPDEVTVDSRGVRWVRREGQQPLDKAWAQYDAEHGYAPDEARIRADERAKCAAELRAQAEHYAVTLDTPPDSDERRAAITVAVILLSAAKRMDGTDPGIVVRPAPAPEDGNAL